MRSSSKTVLKQPSYIADGDKYHQQHQQCKTDKMYAALNLRIKVLAALQAAEAAPYRRRVRAEAAD